ncbi:MAG: hypothetical protein M1836_004687 [Candelina mexicana]|nr:MAG: hypothetical protein M1836_004687 [Candelina mexicana]
MIYLPPLRRFMLPALILLAIIVFYKSSSRVHTPLPSFVIQHFATPPEGIRIPISELKQHRLPILNVSENYRSPPHQYYYSYDKDAATNSSSGSSPKLLQPILNPSLAVLFRCPRRPNKFTNHIRLPNLIHNISGIPSSPVSLDSRAFWNPTIISLPYWSKNQYLVVSRILTDGLHQENVLCEANICYVGTKRMAAPGEIPCTQDDIAHVGPAGGMRCATPPMLLSVPPTPAEYCAGKTAHYADIPGFHDPRIFWSGKGEPLMMVNTHLTELTRNPPESRFPIEKNWMFFFSGAESFLHYEISPRGGRSFAKLLGGGLTTTNLTDPLETPCLKEISSDEPDPVKKNGTWHQATNSLRLVLCERSDANCKPNKDNTVFFAVVHRKHLDTIFRLPLRYERYFIVWSAYAPFSMLGVSQHPILMANETASGWSPAENWDDDAENIELLKQGREGKGYWAHFTYTVSIAYAWGREGDEPMWKNTGFLDDEVVLGVGVDDAGQGFARVRAGELVQCLRACPGRRGEGGSGMEGFEMRKEGEEEGRWGPERLFPED